MAQGAIGLVTASHRFSPQGKIVAHIARALGVPCRVHTATGELSPELMAAQAAGADVIPHPAGYTTVVARRALDDPESQGWEPIPFGMEGEQAVQQMAAQAHATVAQMQNQGLTARRVVVPVGSGMSLVGILHGFAQASFTVPVVGVQVRADSTKRLNRWAPPDWPNRCRLVRSELDFHKPAPVVWLCDVELDPIFEAKCLPFLEPGDLLWVVGFR